MRLGQTRDCGTDRIPRMDPLGPSTAFKVRGATRGQGRTHGDERTWWRGLRITERRKTYTLRLLVQVIVTVYLRDWRGPVGSVCESTKGQPKSARL